MKRTRIIYAAASVATLAVIGGVFVGGALTKGQQESHLGGDLSQIDITLHSPASPISAQVRTAVTGSTPEIDAASARPIMVRGNEVAYVARSRSGPDRLCLFAAREEADGVWAGATCAPREAVGAGRMVVQLQADAGGLDVARTYYGLVPDGVRSVNASWSAHADVNQGVYALERPDALDGAGTLNYEREGQTVTIPLG